MVAADLNNKNIFLASIVNSLNDSVVSIDLDGESMDLEISFSLVLRPEQVSNSLKYYNDDATE